MNALVIERTRTSDDLCTPSVVLEALKPLGPIALDPCSNPWSKVGARVTLDGTSPQEDGLTADWLEIAGDGLVYCNPPYSRGELAKWSRRIAAWGREGCEIVALVPATPDTRWWDRLRKEARAIAYWHGRLRFEGGAHGAGTFGSAAMYFGPRPYLFAHALQEHADVRVIG